jgi:hypothetical protein
MHTLSAAEAISPAIERTKTFLFSQFRWGTFLKLCLVAVLTEGFGSFNFHSSGSGDQSSSSSPANLGFHPTPEIIAVIAAAVALAIVLSFVIAYLITRLRFAYFHCLIHNSTEIGPGWRLYGAQAARYFWMNVVVGICFLVLLAIVALPFVAGFMRLYKDQQAGGQLDVGLLLSLLLPLIPIFLLFLLVCFAAEIILHDLMLPHYALDNATAGQAFNAAWERIVKAKGSFFFYALLRIVLPIAAMILIFIVMLIPAIVFIGATAGIEYVLHSAYEGATGGAAAFGIFLQIVVGIVAFAIAFLVSLCIGGPLSTGVREYALVFYGGRYQALGDILAAPPPADPSLSAP